MKTTIKTVHILSTVHLASQTRTEAELSRIARRRLGSGVRFRLATLTAILVMACRPDTTNVAAEPVATPEPASPENGRGSSPQTFRLQPVEAAEEDPGFQPVLAATAVASTPGDVVHFGWKAPCRVPVRHYNYRSDQGGSIMRMTLDFGADGDGYRVRLADFAFETVFGQPADSPEFRDEVQRVEAAAAAAMPYFRVSTDGRYRGLSEQDEIIEFVLTEVGPAASQQIAEVLRSPATKAQIEAKSGDYWKGWVELWEGLQLRPGETTSQRRRLPFFGDAFETDLVITNLGTVDGHPSLRLYESRQILEGPEALRIMLEHLRSLAKQMGGPPPPDDAIKSFRRETTMHVAIEPAGAKPHRARYLMVTDVDDKRRIEVTDWEFDWSRAQGCTT